MSRADDPPQPCQSPHSPAAARGFSVSPQSCSGLFPVALEAEDLRSGCLSLKGSEGSRRQYWGWGLVAHVARRKVGVGMPGTALSSMPRGP